MRSPYQGGTKSSVSGSACSIRARLTCGSNQPTSTNRAPCRYALAASARTRYSLPGSQLMATIWSGCTFAPKPITRSAKRARVASSMTAGPYFSATLSRRGGVREWLNRAVSKTVVRATVPRVRIPPPPPQSPRIPPAERVRGASLLAARPRRQVNVGPAKAVAGKASFPGFPRSAPSPPSRWPGWSAARASRLVPTRRVRMSSWVRCIAAVAGGSAVVADRLCSVAPGLVGDDVIAPVSIPCVCGVHVAGLSRTPGRAGLTSASAEAAGGVKRSPSGPSAASCEAVLLTPADVRS